MLKAFSGIEYFYSPASYTNANCFIIISSFSLKSLEPSDAILLLKKASNDIQSFVKKQHGIIIQQRTQRIFGKDCIATITNFENDVEQIIKKQLKAEIFYHTRFDK